MTNGEIIATLKSLELEYECTILFACESGSRAWGFASPDSDYDIRFIYAHPLAWYLNIEDKDDTINKMLPGDLDFCGWELQKTLRLFSKCNLCLNEWLNSPYIYYKNENFHKIIKKLIPEYFNPKKAMHHYLSTAKKITEMYLQTNPTNIKKLFYVLRPLFACIWIKNRQTMPPTVFRELLNQQNLPYEIIKFINFLLIEKNISSEKHNTNLPKEISAWINEQIIMLTNESNNLSAKKQIACNPLNKIMHEIIYK